MNNANSGEIRKGSPPNLYADCESRDYSHTSEDYSFSPGRRSSSPSDLESDEKQGSPEESSDNAGTIAEILFGYPVLPIDKFGFGRKMGYRMKRLFPGGLSHVFKGIRAGIEEAKERQSTRWSGGEADD